MIYSDRDDLVRRRATGLLLVVAACSPPETADESAEDPWGPCGAVTTTEFGASDEAELVVPGWTVAEVLELVGDSEIAIEWTGWDPAYFSNPAPDDSTTTLRLNVALDTATLRGNATEIDDAICGDWVDVIVNVEVTTEDGILAGITDARFTVAPETGEVGFYFSADATELNLMTVWPAAEPRPMPDEAVLRGETSAPAAGLGAQPEGGGLWLHWVWTEDDRDGATRVEEIVSLARFI